MWLAGVTMPETASKVANTPHGRLYIQGSTGMLSMHACMRPHPPPDKILYKALMCLYYCLILHGSGPVDTEYEYFYNNI